MSSLLAWLCGLGLSPSEFRVMAHLCQFEVCFQTSQNIAEACRIDRDTFYSVVGRLETKGLIRVEKRPGQTTRYTAVRSLDLEESGGRVDPLPVGKDRTLPVGKDGTGIHLTRRNPGDGSGEPVGKDRNELNKNNPLGVVSEVKESFKASKLAGSPENGIKPETSWLETPQGQFLGRLLLNNQKQRAVFEANGARWTLLYDLPTLEAAWKTATLAQSPNHQGERYKPIEYFVWVLNGERPIAEGFLPKPYTPQRSAAPPSSRADLEAELAEVRLENAAYMAETERLGVDALYDDELEAWRRRYREGREREKRFSVETPLAPLREPEPAQRATGGVHATA